MQIKVAQLRKSKGMIISKVRVVVMGSGGVIRKEHTCVASGMPARFFLLE